MCVCVYLSTSSVRLGCDTSSIFKGDLTGLNSEFSFSSTGCHMKVKKPCLPNYLPIVWGRVAGFMPFPGVIALYEMQTGSSRIWTRVTVFIYSDNNYYTTSAFGICGGGGVYVYTVIKSACWQSLQSVAQPFEFQTD